MKNYLDELKGRLASLMEQENKLSGQIKNLERDISIGKSEQDESLRLAKIAKEQGFDDQVVLKTRMAGRRVGQISNLQDLYNRMNRLLAVIRKMREVSQVVIADLTDEIAIREKEWKTMNIGYRAYSSAAKILNQGGDSYDMFNTAMEYTTEQYGKKLGEIEEFMTISQNFIQGIDLNNLMYEKSAEAALQAWEEKGDSLLLTQADRKQIALQPAISIFDMEVKEKVPVGRTGDVDDKKNIKFFNQN